MAKDGHSSPYTHANGINLAQQCPQRHPVSFCISLLAMSVFMTIVFDFYPMC